MPIRREVGISMAANTINPAMRLIRLDSEPTKFVANFDGITDIAAKANIFDRCAHGIIPTIST